MNNTKQKLIAALLKDFYVNDDFLKLMSVSQLKNLLAEEQGE